MLAIGEKEDRRLEKRVRERRDMVGKEEGGDEEGGKGRLMELRSKFEVSRREREERLPSRVCRFFATWKKRVCQESHNLAWLIL